MAAEWLTVRTADRRDLEVRRSGSEDGLPLVFHAGTPSAASDFPQLTAAASERGWQVLTAGEALTKFLEAQVPSLVEVTGAQIAEAVGELVDHVDRGALTGDFAEEMATTMRRAVSAGIVGWRDDDLAERAGI